MERPWCKCDGNGECIGCMIEQKLSDTNSLREIIVKHYFGSQGMEYFESHMKDAIFIMENPELFKGK